MHKFCLLTVFTLSKEKTIFVIDISENEVVILSLHLYIINQEPQDYSCFFTRKYMMNKLNSEFQII
jgi:hypothetical protein